MSKKTVLIVEDSKYMQELIRSSLPKDYEVVGVAGDEPKAVALAVEHQPDLITMDNILPDTFGVDITQAIREKGVKSKILVISSLTSEAVVQKQIGSGANGYLAKPFTEKELKKALDNLNL